MNKQGTARSAPRTRFKGVKFLIMLTDSIGNMYLIRPCRNIPEGIRLQNHFFLTENNDKTRFAKRSVFRKKSFNQKAEL